MTRTIFTVLMLSVPILSAVPATARTQYPYCIIFGDGDGARMCNIRTLGECYAQRVGTDMCVVNPLYAGPPQAGRAPRRPR